MDELRAWLTGRLQDDWFIEAPEITTDRDEIVIVGRLAEPDGPIDQDRRAGAEAGRITRFREETREDRMQIARELEYRYGRKVAWGARCGETHQLFTTASVPVMTRLRQSERMVLDTLVDAGVARSRSDALGWCVRLVGQHSSTWLGDLRNAIAEVDRIRRTGPIAD